MPYAATRTAVKKNTQTKKAPRRRFRIFSQSLQLFPWLELQQLLNKKPARAACPWLSLLDTVCGRDPLPIGPSTKSTWPPPRNVVGWLFVRKSESLEHETSAGAIDFGLGQRTSACGIVPGFVFPSDEPVPAGGRRARVQVQEPASFAHATVITLCAEILEWAKFRGVKRAAKFHLLLDQDGFGPFPAG